MAILHNKFIQLMFFWPIKPFFLIAAAAIERGYELIFVTNNMKYREL